MILDIIATGGMGTIYRAHQLSMGRQVALKLLSGNDLRDPEFVERFIREARATAQLRSPHTIVLHDFGRCDDSSMFIAMELLSGTSLDNLLRQAPMHPTRVRRLMIQVCLSLEEAHSRGLVHRDIKPSNIMIENEGTPEEFVKVLDFGLVKVTDNPDPNQMALTRPGTIHGTPPYMAPEMWSEGVEIGPAVDIYAFGATMYEMLTGKRAFMAKSIPALLHKHMSEAPPHLEHPALQPFDSIIQRCLAKKIEERYPNIKSLRIDLMRLGADERRELPPLEETDLIPGRGTSGAPAAPTPSGGSKLETWMMDNPQPTERKPAATTPLVAPTLPVVGPDKTRQLGITENERPMVSSVSTTEPGSIPEVIQPPAAKPKLVLMGATFALISAVAFAVMITRQNQSTDAPIADDPMVATSSVTVVRTAPPPPPPPVVKAPPPPAPPPPRVKPRPAPKNPRLSIVKVVALDSANAGQLVKDIERQTGSCVRDVLKGRGDKLRIHVFVRPDGSLNKLRVQPENLAFEACLWSKVSSLRVPAFEGAGFATVMAELEP